MTDEIDPSELTVSEIRDEVAEIDDAAVLEGVLADENNGKDRKTAKEAIMEQLKSLDGTEVVDTADDDGDGDDEEPEADRHNPHGEFVHVRPVNGGGHIAGFSFDDGETKQVKFNAKVQRALSKGELQLIR